MTLTNIDFYKADHRNQYPEGTELVFSNWTARKSRLEDFDHVILFGLQYFALEYLIKRWNRDFFDLPKEEVVEKYRRRMTNAGISITYEHIEELHDYGRMPLEIWALPEGTKVPIGVPSFVMWNTKPEFFWITNYIETSISSIIWGPSTSATIASRYRKILDRYAEETGGDPEFVGWQGHDFSYRGMYGTEAASMSGAGHLVSFSGTDTVPAIDFVEEYYMANSDEELVGGSVSATEHSVMCLGTKKSEQETFRRLIEDVYPNGIVSIVSDTWDYWKVLTEYLPELKDKIMARDGVVTIRPDSGDPVKIIVGDPDAPEGTPERRGSFEILWDTFGGTMTDKGYKLLDQHINLIYGDSITLERAEAICAGLKAKGFVPKMILGIGSFTYCVSPDTNILCSDLKWRKAGEVKEGQEIISFNENPNFQHGSGTGGSSARRFEIGTVTNNIKGRKESIRISTDIGDDITSSTDHPWLCWENNPKPEDMYIDGIIPEGIVKSKISRAPGLIWKKTEDLQVGDKVAFFTKKWEEENTRSAGWLAGMFDGEGSLGRSTPEENRIAAAWKVSISQNRNAIYNDLINQLQSRDYDLYIYEDRSCPHIVLKGGWREILRFLGTIRPERLIHNKLHKIIESMPFFKRNYTYDLATITKIEKVGVQDVASITTSSGTFITEGYLTHNTYNTRDTFGFAMKATAGIVNGEMREIFKDPATDDGTKKSAKGLLAVFETDDGFELVEQATWEQVKSCAFERVFADGEMIKTHTLSEIRERVAAN